MIYADNAATTKMSETAIHTMTSMLQETWGNPSSLYGHGQRLARVGAIAIQRIAREAGNGGERFLRGIEHLGNRALFGLAGR